MPGTTDPCEGCFDQIDALLDKLVHPGYAIHDNFLSADEARALREEGARRRAAGNFSRAGIGRAAGLQTADDVRRDDISWLDNASESPIECAYMQRMDQFLQKLNRELYLGLAYGEFHYAHYPVGAFYKRHLDRFRDDDARTISCVCYLNDAWNDHDGGQLRLWPDASRPDNYLDINPVAGRLVVFRSDSVWHEVLPAQRERWSITGWLRRQDRGW